MAVLLHQRLKFAAGLKFGVSMFSLKAISVLLSLAGIGISLYANHVEKAKHEDPTYEAMCDISEHMSCSDVLTSEYSRGFGFLGNIFGDDSPLVQPNSLYGMGFYAAMFVLSLVGGYYASLLQFILSILSLIGSVYLGYILYILQDICLVCVTTYVLNALLFGISYAKFKNYKGKKLEKAGKGRQSSKKKELGSKGISVHSSPHPLQS